MPPSSSRRRWPRAGRPIASLSPATVANVVTSTVSLPTPPWSGVTLVMDSGSRSARGPNSVTVAPAASAIPARRGFGHALAEQALTSGAAAERFARMVAALGGPADVLRHARLPTAPVQRAAPAPHAGFVTHVDVRALGLAVVNEELYVLGRDQITLLHDFNKDGEADFYQNFNNDVQVTSNFHEFMFDLQTDSQGNFYFLKGGPVNPGGRGWGPLSDHHGCIFKVSADGKKFEVYATGIRAPNGMGVGPNGEISNGDNQGTWVPVDYIHFSKPGEFIEVPDLAHRTPAPTKYSPHLCWVPYDVDNSNGGQIWVPANKGKWGPFEGRMLYLSYGKSSLFAVLQERVGDVAQGGVVKLAVLEGRLDRVVLNWREGLPVDREVVQAYIDKLQPGTVLRVRDIERVVGVILESMIQALEDGGRVELRGFGALSVRSRDARAGRNPRTGESVDVRAKHVPFFKSGK